MVAGGLVHAVDQHEAQGVIRLQGHHHSLSQLVQGGHGPLFKLALDIAVFVYPDEVKPQSILQAPVGDGKAQTDVGSQAAAVGDGEELGIGHTRLPVDFPIENGGSDGFQILPLGLKGNGLAAVYPLDGNGGAAGAHVIGIGIDGKITGSNHIARVGHRVRKPGKGAAHEHHRRQQQAQAADQHGTLGVLHSISSF